MSTGPGVYDARCTTARDLSDAESAILIIVKGVEGSGFSVQTRNPQFAQSLPLLLRTVADQIETENRGRVAGHP